MGGQERRVVVGGLTPATQYSLRVAAENHVGRGRSSPPVIASTEEQPPSAPPRSVSVSVVGFGSVFPSVSAPEFACLKSLP